jgi:hypothetical protein
VYIFHVAPRSFLLSNSLYTKLDSSVTGFIVGSIPDYSLLMTRILAQYSRCGPVIQAQIQQRKFEGPRQVEKSKAEPGGTIDLDGRSRHLEEAL